VDTRKPENFGSIFMGGGGGGGGREPPLYTKPRAKRERETVGEGEHFKRNRALYRGGGGGGGARGSIKSPGKVKGIGSTRN